MDRTYRVFFIGATFGKYLEHYTAANDYLLEEYTFDDIMESTCGELEGWFKQPPLTQKELGLIQHYLHTTEERLFELDKEEKKKLK